MPKTTLIDCCIKKYAYREVSQIYQELEVSQDGLSQTQIESMREKYGANSFSKRKNECCDDCAGHLSIHLILFFWFSELFHWLRMWFLCLILPEMQRLLLSSFQ